MQNLVENCRILLYNTIYIILMIGGEHMFNLIPGRELVKQRLFHFFAYGLVREQNICQYIRIPFKTARPKIEILLQIDVSKHIFMNRHWRMGVNSENGLEGGSL